MTTTNRLAALTTRWKEDAAKKAEDNANTGGLWKKKFDFWKADFNTTTTFRFVADKNDDNPDQFFIKNFYHELWVNGKKEVFACNKHQHGGTCPLCELSAKYYNEKSPDYNPTLGKKYYRKLEFISQGVVIDTPLEHEQATVVKYITYSKAMHERIMAALSPEDLDDIPWAYATGYNYRITKTAKKTPDGEVGDYSTSSFRTKVAPLSEDLIEKIEEQRHDLTDFLPKTLSNEAIEALMIAAQNDTGRPARRQEAPAPAGESTSEGSGEGQDSPAPAAAPTNNLAALKARIGARRTE